MKISSIHIKGFRNFNDEQITFQDKTLIIGANDVGKSNLIYALRLLFDKSISERDLELSDSDYNAYSGANEIEITVTITDVVEECLLSAFGGYVKDGTLLIRYTNSKGGSYQLFVGFSENTLAEITTRQYIRRLNMQCVDTNRDLFGFLKHERVQMLRLAKEKLSEAATLEDTQKAAEIQEKLNSINAQVSSMHYITSALDHEHIIGDWMLRYSSLFRPQGSALKRQWIDNLSKNSSALCTAVNGRISNCIILKTPL